MKETDENNVFVQNGYISISNKERQSQDSQNVLWIWKKKY